MQRNDETPDVKDGKLVLEGVDSIGLGLVPLPGNVGRYPVVVIINNETRPVLLESGAIYTHHELIKTATVDVTVGGGVDGDRWRVLKRRTESERVEGPYPTNEWGKLETVPAGGVTLFDLDSRVDATPFINVFSGTLIPSGGIGAYVVAPDAPTRFTWGLGGPVWDVTGFARVIFGVEAGGLNGPSLIPTDSITAYVAGFGRPTSFYSIQFLGCGAVNQFGTGGGATWNGSPGTVWLGTGLPESVTDYEASSAKKAPYLRFMLNVATGSVDPTDVLQGNYWLRVYAQGLYT